MGPVESRDLAGVLSSIGTIIHEAASGPLGILALFIVLVGAVGLIFFYREEVRYRMAVFILLLAGAAMFSVQLIFAQRDLTTEKLSLALEKRSAALQDSLAEALKNPKVGEFSVRLQFPKSAPMPDAVETSIQQRGQPRFVSLDSQWFQRAREQERSDDIPAATRESRVENRREWGRQEMGRERHTRSRNNATDGGEMRFPRARLIIATAILCLLPHRYTAGQVPGLGTCRTRTSFVIPEGATRRVDLPDGHLSVFAEEIKDGNDRSHFYVALSDSPLATSSEVLKESDFERRLRLSRIARTQTRALKTGAYARIDPRAGRAESLQLPSGTMTLTLSNPRRHRLADVVLCFA
jgi:hypothetical protein